MNGYDQDADCVDTIFGRLPRRVLDVTDHIEENARFRTVKTIWTLRETINVEGEDGSRNLITFTYPPMQDSEGNPIPGSERVVTSIKGEVAKADAHVVAKVGISAKPEQGFVN